MPALPRRLQLMISLPPAPSFVTARKSRRLSSASVLGLWLYAACSVYDSSLLPSGAMPGGASGNVEAGMGAEPAIAGAKDGGGSGAGAGGGVGGAAAGTTAGMEQGTSGSGGMGGGGFVEEGGAPSTGGEGQGGTAEGGAPTERTPQELAVGKNALASTTQTNYDAFKGNDADNATRWCAVDGKFPQWWRVDLGEAHALESFSVRFEYPERAHSYLIEISQDDVTYVAVPGTTATDVVGEVQSGSFPDGTSARYVRISVTNAAPPSDPNEQPRVTWASFYELSVLGF